MNLKSFGCSFIFGTDLADAVLVDANKNLPFPHASHLTWPAHLAQYFGYQYTCHAKGGSGNLQIAEQVLSHLADPEPCFYVIGWTWIDRFDYNHLGANSKRISDSDWNYWQTLMPADLSDTAQNYYRDLHSEYRDKLCSLMQIKLVIDTLNQRGQKFLMTYMDKLLFDCRWNHTPAVLELQEFILPHMTTFEGQTFLEYSQTNGFEISASMHPLEKAHLAAAQIVINTFDKQKTNGLTR